MTTIVRVIELIFTYWSNKATKTVLQFFESFISDNSP